MSAVAYLGAIRELVGGQVDLAKGTLSDETTESVVANGAEVFVRELAGSSGG